MLTAIKNFLLRERTLGARRPPAGRVRRRRNRQRGVALVAVMIAIAITLVIANEFGTSTNSDMMAAANYRDQMRSHFLARSAVNLSELVIRIQQRLDNASRQGGGGAGGGAAASALGGIQITDFADQVLLAFCGTSDEVQAAIGMSSSDVKGLGADIGTCGVTGSITSEDDKLNLNCANSNNWQTLKSLLDALVYFAPYDPVFEEADAENYRRDRATQVAAIMDYIDSDSLRVRDRGTTEDYGYESLKDRYRAKNTYIDTVGEIRLARGVDDRFWTLFGSSFTAYGGCKINISSVTNPQLIASLLFLAAEDANAPVLQDPAKLFLLADLVIKAKQFGLTFNRLPDFAEFVKDPAAKLTALAGAGAGSAITGMLGGQKLGLALNATKLGQAAAAGPRRTYRVEAWGEIERKQKMADGTPVFPPIRTTITGVWDTRVIPQNVRKPPAPRGGWVYLRED
jgi:type II secretory pathway component PulK